MLEEKTQDLMINIRGLLLLIVSNALNHSFARGRSVRNIVSERYSDGRFWGRYQPSTSPPTGPGRGSLTIKYAAAHKRGSDEYPANRPGPMTVADAAAARHNQVPLGIAYMVGSTAMFAGGNAVVKWQLATYPLGEVAFGRTLFAFLTVAAIVLPRAGWSVLRTRRYREHLQRGLSQFGSSVPAGRWVSEGQVRIGLTAGGSWIRTLGPP